MPMRNEAPSHPEVGLLEATLMKINSVLGTADAHQCRRCFEWIADGEEPDGCRDPDCPEN